MAEVVVLRSGNIISGEIVLQNDEVVIIRTASGMRYQYPMTQVREIKQEISMQEQVDVDSDQIAQIKAVSLRIQAMGGALYVPHLGWGAYAGADMLVGANVLEGKRMFVGGSVGYRAKIMDDETFSFIPLQASFSAILSDQRHAPIVGVNLGYGFSTNRKTQGGICAGADIGWYYAVSQTASIALGLSAEWQNAQTDIVQTITNPNTQEQNNYINHMGVNFITFGVRVAILF